MEHANHANEIGTGIVKLAPPVYVAGTSIMGVIDWQMWVYVVTLIYLIMQVIQFVYEKWIKPWRKRGK